ncbi:hypothetical protein V4Q83_14775 [Acinetobacter baumannii]|nr:hypothetical protein [Acinetobacter baumannii]MBE0312712.1 hypothetical protein [Acinetobacter baumannii]MCZ3147613.1 hypothetical protein [Acinetobacter baumannii]
MAIIMGKKSKNKKLWSYFKIFLFFSLLLGLILLWAYFPFILNWIDKYNTPIQVPLRPTTDIHFKPFDFETHAQKIGEKYGTYGDSYGALNTLFSGLAFVFLILSLYLQGDELKAQRNEIKEQRREIKRSNKIAKQQRKITNQQAKLLKQQIKDAKQQHFNENFFNLLQEKNRRIESMKYRDLSGNAILNLFSHKFLNTIENIILEGMDDTNQEKYREHILDEVVNTYLSFYDQWGSPFERTLYINYINDLIHYIEDNAAKEYMSESIQLLRMYMTHDEIMCIAFLAMIYPNLGEKVNKYGLLANFNTDENMYAEIRLKLIFSKEAFEYY